MLKLLLLMFYHHFCISYFRRVTLKYVAPYTYCCFVIHFIFFYFICLRIIYTAIYITTLQIRYFERMEGILIFLAFFFSINLMYSGLSKVNASWNWQFFQGLWLFYHSKPIICVKCQGCKQPQLRHALKSF